MAKILRKLKPLTANVYFKDFELKEMGGHHYLCSTASDGDSVGTEHIGSFRISIQYAKCGKANVMGQLVQNPSNSQWTFRKWNPEKDKVPFGEDTSQKTEAS